MSKADGPTRVIYGVNPVKELLRGGGGELSELWLAEGARSGAVAELELTFTELHHSLRQNTAQKAAAAILPFLVNDAAG